MFGKQKKAKNTTGTTKTDILTYLEWAAKPTTLQEAMDWSQLMKQQEFQSFFQQAMQNEAAGREALTQLSCVLGQMDAFQSCLAAHLCGALIERWGVHETVGRQIVEAFAQTVVLACEFVADAQELLGCTDEDLFNEETLEKLDMQEMFAKAPDRTRAFLGCDLITLAAMAVITREHASRFYLRELGIYLHIQYLQQLKEKLYYVEEVYKACVHLPVTVLSPKTMRGFQMVVHDLSNCFHLFTLLEAELYRRDLLEEYAIADYVWDEAIVQIATGAVYPQQQASIAAHQQYYTVHAVQADGSYQITRETEQGLQVNPEALVWGEMPPEAIPEFAGRRVIIIDSEGMFKGRSWDVSFVSKCHDALEPKLEITEMLSETECRLLWEEIKQAQA